MRCSTVTFRRYMIAVTAAILFTAITAQAQHPGLAFLRVPPDAAGAGAGGANAAAGTGLRALQWNPAGMLAEKRSEIAFTHVEGFEDTDSEYFTLLYQRSEKTAYALNLFANNINNIEFRTQPTAQPEGVFGAHFFYGGLSYARRIGENYRIGFTGKYIYQKIYMENAAGFALDAGVRFAPPGKRYSAGFVLKNFGSMSELKNESTDLPALIRAGAAYRLPTGWNRQDVTLSGDYETIVDGDDHIHIGAEYGYADQYFVRGGYVSGYDAGRFSAGAGILFGNYGFDYAYLPDVTSFGNQHIMTLRLRF